LTGTVLGVDTVVFDVVNHDTLQVETKKLTSLTIIGYRAKVLIPETEMWIPGAERPPHVMQSMIGSKMDYVIMEIDREGECAIGSRRVAQAAKRHFFKKNRAGHVIGERLRCQVVSSGPKHCTVECCGYDVLLTQRNLSYTTIPDLRLKFRPGQELDCVFKGFDSENDSISISVKEAEDNPFIGAEHRHPKGSRRQAMISGKYAGGVFCTLPDDTVCLCLYSPQHSDYDFELCDNVIIVISRYDYDRQLIVGRILAKW
jgi:ribosomal protein S1